MNLDGRERGKGEQLAGIGELGNRRSTGADTAASQPPGLGIAGARGPPNCMSQRQTGRPGSGAPAKRGIRPPPSPGDGGEQPTKATTGNPLARRRRVHIANLYRSGNQCLPTGFAVWIRISERRFMPDPIGGPTLECLPATGGSRVLLQPEFRDRQRAASSLLTFRPAPALGPRERVQICTLTSVHVDRQMGREQPADIEPRTCPLASLGSANLHSHLRSARAGPFTG